MSNEYPAAPVPTGGPPPTGSPPGTRAARTALRRGPLRQALIPHRPPPARREDSALPADTPPPAGPAARPATPPRPGTAPRAPTVRPAATAPRRVRRRSRWVPGRPVPLRPRAAADHAGRVRAAQILIWVMAGLVMLVVVIWGAGVGAEDAGRLFATNLMGWVLFVLAFRYGTGGNAVCGSRPSCWRACRS
ncbi:hypothetical protein LV779_13345 [Streptomyces thinghirensis]|nr:hypothetical protein [Streptomyces thinghirensis]